MAYKNFTNCTEEEYTQLIYSQDDTSRIRIWFNNVELQDADEYCESLTGTNRILPNDGSKRFSLDNFIAKEYTLTLRDLPEETELVDQVKISMGTLVDSSNDTWEDVPLGIFNIQDTPQTDQNKITIKLRDNRVKFDFNYNAQPLIESLGGTATKKQILNDICEKAGVINAITSFYGEDDSIGIYDNSITATTYVSYIMEQAGATPIINRNGELDKIDYDNLKMWAIPLSIIEKYEIGTPYNIERVVYESGIIKYETNNDNTKQTLYLNAANPYVSSQEQIEYIYNNLKNFEIDSLTTGKVLGNPAIDPYDIIIIYDDEVESTPYINGQGETITLDNTIENNIRLDISPTQSVRRNLPIEYTQVDYIKNSGTQYIDTGFYPSFDNGYRFEIEYEPTNLTARACLLSNYAGTNHISFELTAGTGNQRIYINNGNVDNAVSGTIVGKNIGITSYYNGTVTDKVNNNEYTRNATFTGSSGSTLYLFVDNAKRFNVFTNYLKIYSCKIYDGYILVRNFIPCYRNSDNVIGMYDLVNNVFYTNAGTGTFIKGNDSVPTPYTPLEIHNSNKDNKIIIVGKNIIDYTTDFVALKGWGYRTITGTTTKTITLTATQNNDTWETFGVNVSKYVGKQMTISFDAKINSGNVRTFINSVNDGIYGSQNEVTLTENYKRFSHTFDSALNTLEIMTLRQGNGDAASIELKNICISVGTNSEYYEYNPTYYSLDLGVTNLFDTSTSIAGTNFTKENNVYTSSGLTNWANGIIKLETVIPIEARKNYYISYDIKTDSGDIKNLNYFGRLSNDNVSKITTFGFLVGTFTMSDSYQRVIWKTTGNDNYDATRFIIQAGNNITNAQVISIKNIQVSEEIGAFTPYGQEPIEYCKIGTYSDRIFKNVSSDPDYDSELDEDEWYLKKVISKYQLDSTKSWYVQSSNDYQCTLATDNRIYLDSSGKGISNYFTVGSSGTGIYMFPILQSGTDYIRIVSATSQWETTDDFKSFLSNNNVYLYYPSSNITYKKITGTLANQLEAIYNSKSKEGQTNILQINNDLPFEIDATAFNNSFVAKSLANNNYSYNGVHRNMFETTIGLEERKENVSLKGEATFKKWAKTEIDNVNNQIITTVGEVQTIQEEINGSITYDLTEDTEYLADKEYYSYDDENDVYVLLQAGVDYEVGDTISGEIYELSTTNSLSSRLDDIKDAIEVINTTMLTQTAEQFEMLFTQTGIKNDLDNLSTLLDDNNSTLNEISQYIRFAGANIELGRSDSNTKLVITNDRISFMTGDNESAYISDNQLYITDSTILNKLRVGHWETKEDENFNLNTRWVND